MIHQFPFVVNLSIHLVGLRNDRESPIQMISALKMLEEISLQKLHLCKTHIEKDVYVTITGPGTIKTDASGKVQNITSTISLAVGSGNLKQSN